MSIDIKSIPTWEEGIARLVFKLPDLIGSGGLTINDARVIDHLVSHYYKDSQGEGDNDCNS